MKTRCLITDARIWEHSAFVHIRFIQVYTYQEDTVMRSTLEPSISAGRRTRTPLNRTQIVGFWGAWAGWTLDGMDSFIYALVLAPALTELLPKSGYAATPAN